MSTTPSRLRPTNGESPSPSNTKHQQSPFSLSPSPTPKTRPKSVPPYVNKTNTTSITTTSSGTAKSKRSLILNKPKSVDYTLPSQKGGDDIRVFPRSGFGNRQVVEQFAKPRRHRLTDANSVTCNKKDLENKLFFNDKLIKDLQSEVSALKAELDKTHSLNSELEKQNKKLFDDLVAAQAKVAALSTPPHQREPTGEYKSPKFKDIQKLIANKLEHSLVRKESLKEATSIQTPLSPPNSKTADTDKKAPPCPPIAAPPPPPPPPRPSARAVAAKKAPSLEQLYQSLKKQEGKKDLCSPVNHDKPAAFTAHGSIVGEIQNRSAHLLAIKSDIENKGDFINGLIRKVVAAAFTDIEDVVKFVDWLDIELSSLADERAVLKHFKWPERKADAMREAAVEYKDLKLLEIEISSYKDDACIPCATALKKMASLLDKSERSMQRLTKLRNSVMRAYQDCKIPVDWMLDSGIMSKIKQGSMKLAQTYMKRVTMELELFSNSDRESTQEALLLQGVHFAYRAHQFAGGLDSETMCAFEEIRQRVPGHQGGYHQLLAAIPSI